MICEGRVAIVTGAGRGIGRGHALELAAQGAKVVVNDLGGTVDGSGADIGPAQTVVDEITALGGEAVANTDDVADWDGARRLVQTAIDTYGTLDVLVNNAGILRDRMLFNMEEAEWDAVVRVHMKGTFAPMRWAAAYWREQSKNDRAVDARVINTSSTSGLFANPGQSNYGAAKSGIATLSIIGAKELGRYGVTVNAIAPGARTRMTENLGPPRRRPSRGSGTSAHPRTSRRSSPGWQVRNRLRSPGRSSSLAAAASRSPGRGRAARGSTTGRAGTQPSSVRSSRSWCARARANVARPPAAGVTSSTWSE